MATEQQAQLVQNGEQLSRFDAYTYVAEAKRLMHLIPETDKLPLDLRWQAPVLWPDNTVVIIGGGPSLKQMDLTRLRRRHRAPGVRVIGCNDAYALGEDTVDLCYFGDDTWYWIHNRDWVEVKGHRDESHPGLLQFGGLKVTCSNRNLGDATVMQLERRPFGLYKAPLIGWYLNTGVSAINLAIMLGAKRIVLLGFDMKLSSSQQPNWHENLNYPKPVANTYDGFLRCAKRMAADLDRHKSVEVINCSPDSALEVFPKARFEDIVSINPLSDKQVVDVAVVLKKPSMGPGNKWYGGRCYDAHYVRRIYYQLCAACRQPECGRVRLVCLTDFEEILDNSFRGMGSGGIDFAAVPIKRGWAGWWSIIEVFDVLRGPSVLIGLDTALPGNLAPLLNWARDCQPDQFGMVSDFYRPKHLASSVMAWNGDWSFLAEECNYPDAARYYRMEQLYTEAKLLSGNHRIERLEQMLTGIYSYKVHVRNQGLPPDAMVVCFHGEPRPHEVDEPWLKELLGLADEC